MAEDQKLIIEIDADTTAFTAKINGVQQTLGQTASQGAAGFEGMGMEALGLNSILELGQKLLEGFNKALETINEAEAFNNQKTALTALGSQIGLTKQQIDLLVTTLQKASNDTLTTGQATADAYKLLNAGFKAETIPNIVEFARQISLTKPQAGDLNTIIGQLAQSVEQGSTRGLRQIIPDLKTTSDRMATLNAITRMAAETTPTATAQYEDFGKRVKASMAESAEASKNFLGETLKGTAIAIFGSDADKAAEKLKILQTQLDAAQKSMASGSKNVLYFDQVLPAAQGLAKIQADIAAAQAKVNANLVQEKSEIDVNTQAFKQQGEVKKVLDPTQQAAARLQADKQMTKQMLDNSEQFSLKRMNLEKQYSKFATDEENNRFKNEQQEQLSGLKDKGQYIATYESLYKAHQARLKALSLDTTSISTKNFIAGWQDALSKIESSTTNFSKVVSKMATGLQSTMSNSFIQMAKDHQFSMSQMLNNMLEFIGESLVQDGTANLFKGAALSILGGAGAPLMAIGAGEIAAGSALVGATGGSSPPASTAAGSIGTDLQGQAQLSQPNATTTPQKQATIVINGDLLNSQETVNHLEDMIRQNSDTTGFAIVAQGQQY